MDVDVFFVGIAVRDFKVARGWYERFFDRAPDVIAHDTEVMWQVTERGWLYVLLDDAHAGHGIVSVAVPDIEAAASELRARRIEVGPIAPEGDAGRKAVVVDPDGNVVALLEVAAG